uniref:uncharacterized protein LOC124070428 n=1 Tax=Scatophagus argus TaxID=75038 RepID=UPI001ED82F70|nr:uncharacterized protein LOC124070428 [Scatophagus argus]XP_046266300.1 uncharacterized protein LOC124070428 [Scatophagus argus]
MTMGFPILHILLWLLTALALTTQGSGKLNVSTNITAECGKQVTLNCNVTNYQNGLSVKLMAWSRNGTLCNVDSEGKITTHSGHLQIDFHCEYKHGQLSLILHKVRPLDSGKYLCKLRSNKGAEHQYTTVKLQECSGTVQGDQTEDHHICTFSHVYPDGNVHWFHGSSNVIDNSRQKTTKQVDEGGWLTIRSSLARNTSDGPYNCSLMSTQSSRYIASTSFRVMPRSSESKSVMDSAVRNGVGVRTFLGISVLLAFTLK